MGLAQETSPHQNSFPRLSSVSIPTTQYQSPVSILTTLYWLPEGHIKLYDDTCIGLQHTPHPCFIIITDDSGLLSYFLMFLVIFFCLWLLHRMLSTKMFHRPMPTQGCLHFCSMLWPDVFSSSDVSMVWLLAGLPVLLNSYSSVTAHLQQCNH